MLPDWAAVWSVGTSGNQSDRVTQAGLAGGIQTNRTTNRGGWGLGGWRLFQIEDAGFSQTPPLMPIKQNKKKERQKAGGLVLVRSRPS